MRPAEFSFHSSVETGCDFGFLSPDAFFWSKEKHSFLTQVLQPRVHFSFTKWAGLRDEARHDGIAARFY